MNSIQKNFFEINSSKADIDNDLSSILGAISKITWESERPQCCFEENHLVIVTSDGKGFHVNELQIEEKCPLLKEISTIYHERGSKHYKIEIDSSIMAEIVSYITLGVLTVNCRFTARLFKVIRMLELHDLQLIGEYDFLEDLSTDNVFAFLKFADENKLEFLEKEVLNFISVNFAAVRSHQNWVNFARNNPVLTGKIFDSMKC